MTLVRTIDFNGKVLEEKFIQHETNDKYENRLDELVKFYAKRLLESTKDHNK